MNKRAGKPGATKPAAAEIAQFDALDLHQLGRLMAAARIAFHRKQVEVKRLKHKG